MIWLPVWARVASYEEVETFWSWGDLLRADAEILSAHQAAEKEREELLNALNKVRGGE